MFLVCFAVLLNEGRRNSPLARKIVELYNHRVVDPTTDGNHPNTRDDEGNDDENPPEDNRFGSMASSVVVKFVSRSLFDQTKGSTLLKKIAREETSATVV